MLCSKFGIVAKAHCYITTTCSNTGPNSIFHIRRVNWFYFILSAKQEVSWLDTHTCSICLCGSSGYFFSLLIKWKKLFIQHISKIILVISMSLLILKSLFTQTRIFTSSGWMHHFFKSIFTAHVMESRDSTVDGRFPCLQLVNMEICQLYISDQVQKVVSCRAGRVTVRKSVHWQHKHLN